MADGDAGHLGGRPAVFFDRDGAITEEVGYLVDVDRLALIPGAADAIRRINEAGMLAVLVTNQSGAARGLFPLSAIDRAHEKLRRLLAAGGAHLDAIYVCPHHPDGKVLELTRNCECRKPEAGMFRAAVAEWKIDPARSYAIGDSYRDLIPAASLGARTVLVRTGYGRKQNEERQGDKWQPDRVVDDIGAAVSWLLADRQAS